MMRLMLCACCWLVCWPALAVEQPNIIFILCDDLGWGDLGVLHQNLSQHPRRHFTPHLDQMAREGMQLQRHYCPAPVCAPSRSSLLSGVHQGHAEVRDNQFDKALADNHTFASVLKHAGYRTWMIGKYGLQGDGDSAANWPAYPTRRGFDEFYGYVRHRNGHQHYPANRWPLGNSENHRSPQEVWFNEREVSSELDKCYTTDLFTARGKQWIIEHTKASPQQPFFLYLAYDTPHAALQLPTVAFPEGKGIKGGLQWLGQPGKMINTAVGEIDSYRHPDYTGKDWRDVEERFATSVRRIDDCVGDLLQTLRDLEIDRETLVVFSSDNGPLDVSYIAGEPFPASSFQSYGPLEGIKRDVWEGGVRMPTLAWWPDAIAAASIDVRPSQFHDWLPTFADLGGLAPPARSDGVSLKPTLLAEGKQQPGLVYVEYRNGGRTPRYDDFAPDRQGRRRGQMQVIHLEGYKGVRVDIQSHEDPFEIYDLRNDWQEHHDLAGTSPRFERLGQAMKAAVLQCRMPNDSAPRPYDGATIPAVEVPSDVVTGLRWSLFRGNFPYVPNVDAQQADESELADSLDVQAVPSSQGAIRWSGWLMVPESVRGEVVIELNSSVPAFLRIHRAAAIDADFGFDKKKSYSARMHLAPGAHPVTLTTLAGRQPYTLQLRWSVDGEPPVPIPAEAWKSR